MINELIKLATHLDSKGLKKEADLLDLIVKRAMGELINLDDYRDEEDKSGTYEKVDPENLRREFSEIQKILDELSGAEGADIELLLHSDGETYTSLEDTYIVTVTAEEMDKIEGGEKIKNIINENRWVGTEAVINREKLMEIK